MIYFIQAESGGPIKIGVSDHPKSRLRTCQTYNPNKLVLIAAMPGGKSDEEALHRRFSKYKLHGEWFEENDELVFEIKCAIGFSLAFILQSPWSANSAGRAIRKAFEACRACLCDEALLSKWMRARPTPKELLREFACAGLKWHNEHREQSLLKVSENGGTI